MTEPQNFWRRFLARPNDDRGKAIGIAVIVAFVCAVVVSTTSVLLKPRQDAHLEAERAARMAAMLDTLPGMRDLMQEVGVTALETRMVNLSTGRFTDDVDPAGYDATEAAADPETSIEIPSDADIAGIRRRETYAPVHLLERDGELMLLVLPMRATGYQSTIHVMLALEPDLRTVAALSITDHGETPGIGSRITDPAFIDRWPGKQVADDTGAIVIEVVRGTASGPYEVDAISGATRSSNAIGSMLSFWLGDLGYGPFLDRLEQEGL